MKQKMPMNMPNSVVKALSKIWNGNIPANIADICYCYGEVCYTPRPLTKDLEVHEAVHSRQQGSDPDQWWRWYANDPKFRYSQELEAYRRQYQYIKSTQGRNKAFEAVKHFANDMSSPMYGNMCNAYTALQDILRP